jgi:antitoxin component YwqK of YwqJK toxin-antitoxin module
MTIGYKKGRNNNIIVLEIQGENNENRPGIMNAGTAQMMCSSAKVIAIYNQYTDRKSEQARSIHYPNFIYEVNRTVEPDYYDGVNHGIHYYLTVEPANFFNMNPEGTGFVGAYMDWYDNGQLKLQCNYSNRNETSKYNKNVISNESVRHGQYEQYYDSGELMYRCLFINGTIDGRFEGWFPNGENKISCTYQYGRLDGIKSKWLEDGVCEQTKYTYEVEDVDANDKKMMYVTYRFLNDKQTWKYVRSQQCDYPKTNVVSV